MYRGVWSTYTTSYSIFAILEVLFIFYRVYRLLILCLNPESVLESVYVLHFLSMAELNECLFETRGYVCFLCVLWGVEKVNGIFFFYFRMIWVFFVSVFSLFFVLASDWFSTCSLS